MTTSTSRFASVYIGGVFNVVDTVNTTFSVDGGSLPINYFPVVDDDAVLSISLESFGNTTYDFTGSDLSRRVAFESGTSSSGNVDGFIGLDDQGTILISSPDEGLGIGSPSSGTYSYRRTTSNLATLILDYTAIIDGVSTPQTVTFNLTFSATDGGTYTDSNGGSGAFLEDFFSGV